MKLSVLSLSIVSFFVCVGCSSPPKIVTEVSLSIRPEWSQLTASGVPLRAGVFYQLDENGPTPVLDFRERASLNEASGWLQTQAISLSQARRIGEVGIVRRTLSCTKNWFGNECDVERETLAIAVVGTSSQRNQLADPAALMEIINRPITGASYNRTAEERVMLWRATLAAALEDARRDNGVSVALCIGTVEFNQGRIVVNDPLGRLEKSDVVGAQLKDKVGAIIASTLARKIQMGSGFEYSWPLATNLQVLAVFQKVDIVNASPYPHIDFRLGSSTRMGLQ